MNTSDIIKENQTLPDFNLHEMIAASAGSGKTFALASRLIKLIARDRRPERIIALTFSRAAAGEIFDKLVTRLAKAAMSPDNARKEAVDNLNMPSLTQDDFKQILRDVISTMHMSPIGTLDSFFVRILRAFPFEFGITGSFNILDDHSLKIERDHIFRDILQSGTDDTSRTLFLEAFKQATFGMELKTVWERLDNFTHKPHEHYLNMPNPDHWGRPETIWPNGCPWLQPPSPDVKAEAAALRALQESSGFSAKEWERWEAFICLAETFTPQRASAFSNLNSNEKYLLERLLPLAAELERGQASIKIGRTETTLSPEICRHTYALLRHIVSCVLQTKFESSRGLHAILHRYEQTYATRMRLAGKLTFHDITVLLAHSDSEQAPVLTLNPNSAVNRLDIDYRLDGQFDHWALDEFQDTSRQQWHVIQNLIDEVLQDTSGKRSFFAVGDVKQAIYGWRGGDSTLMSEIRRDYNQGPVSPIAIGTLSCSWRSSQTVLDAVNQVFTNLHTIPGLPTPVLDRWQDDTVWQPHKAALKKSGYATLLEVPYEKGATAPDIKEKRYQVMASRLLETKPWEKGLSTAVLVRGNTTGRNVAEYLRLHAIPVAWEGDLAIADNPVVAAFLSLLTFAEHPGDTLAWEHIQMTPLKHYLPTPGPLAKNQACQQILRTLYTGGFEAVISTWWNKIKSHAPDPFTRKRMDELLEAARVFDAEGKRNCLDFVDFVKSYTVREHPSDRVVRVMTMHHSKGLGFDIVFLPELQASGAGNGGITSAGKLDVSIEHPDNQSTPGWVLDLPPNKILEADPVLNDHLQHQIQTSCFESLCLLYVAMTRAKHALYMITSEPGPSSKSIHMSNVLKACLSDNTTPQHNDAETQEIILFENGQPDWFNSMPACTETASKPAEVPKSKAPAPIRQRFKRLLPSAHQEAGLSAASLFTIKARRSLEFGTAIHALFEHVQWLGSEPVENIVNRWQQTTNLPHSLATAVEKAFRHAISFPSVQKILQQPDSQNNILWREKRFELILNNEWVSGTIDRATIHLDNTGKPTSAAIIDFKSDRIHQPQELDLATERYAPQLRLYRTVLSKLTSLPENHITASLLFTNSGQIRTL